MKVLSLTGILAPILFILVVLVAGASTPQYDHTHQFISELGASGASTASLMNYAGFIPTGLLLALFGFVTTRYLAHDKTGYFAGALLVFFGVGVLLAGVFSCDIGCPQSSGSLENTIHDRVSPLAFIAAIIGIGLFAFHFRSDPAWKGRWVYSLITSFLAFVFLIALVSSLESRSYTGLWQRAMLLTLFAWFAVMSLGVYSRFNDNTK